MTSFICGPVVCIDTSERGVLQSMGKYEGTLSPGFNCIFWPIKGVNTVSMKVQQFDFQTDTKTSDNVTVSVKTAIQWCVDENNIKPFYFTLTNARGQMGAYVDDCVRGHLPHMTLDQSYESKVDMAQGLSKSLSDSFADFGVVIVKVLVTDISPDARVLHAMNEINAAKRMRAAALDKAEADKLMMVKRAEAEAESAYLQGVGTAKMRQAIVDGFKGSVENMRESTGMSPQEVVHMMLVTQYLDCLKDFAASGKSSIIVPAGAAAVSDIASQVRNGFIQAKELQG